MGLESAEVRFHDPHHDGMHLSLRLELGQGRIQDLQNLRHLNKTMYFCW